MLFAPIAGLAASGDEFYQRLYQRGMAHFAAGEYASAFTELRNAAFGFVEQVDQFETVQAYAVVAAHRLGHDNDAHDSLSRIVSAEKVQPHFRSVKLPDELRTEVDIVAVALLTTQECDLLGVPAEVQKAAAKRAVVVPTPTKRPNVAVTAPRERGAADDTPPDADLAKTPSRPTPKTPQPVTPVPQPQPVVPQPVKPAQPDAPTATPQPLDPVPSPRPPAPQPKQEMVPAQPQPQPTPPVAKPQPEVKNADASLAEAQHAVDNGEIGRARSIYNALLNVPQLTHAATLRLAEGLYRVRDFAGATRAFQRAGTLGHGEEPYHYYYAVALYESGRYGDAKRELAASLPYISVTPDVARYRMKIEGAIE